jgi:serine/threonine protein kinase
MGSCNFGSDIEATPSISKQHFQLNYPIGKGGFGKVWKVEYKKTKEQFAMKEMSKARILAKKSVNSVISERQLLSGLKHPFIVNMQYAFHDTENLYLVMDLMSGGDLRYHLGRKNHFSEEQAKFFISCVMLGLEYIHNKGILHRDIKPENLVFDSKGFLKITDFGIARRWVQENAKDTSGTPGYMAPEVMCKLDHGVSVDYFALGVILYEIMMGTRPYIGNSRKDIREAVLAKQVQIRKEEIPEGWSEEAADFTNRLLQRKPVTRLGNNGPEEIKAHPWLQGVDWKEILSKSVVPPFVPNDAEDNFDLRAQLVNDPWKDEKSQAFLQSSALLNTKSTQEHFKEYFFDRTQSNSLSKEKIKKK